MPEKLKIEEYFTAAKRRMCGHGGMNGESLVVTLAATRDILDFVEKRAKEWGVSLPFDFHAFRESLNDPAKVQAIIEEGEKAGA